MSNEISSNTWTKGQSSYRGMLDNTTKKKNCVHNWRDSGWAREWKDDKTGSTVGVNSEEIRSNPDTLLNLELRSGALVVHPSIPFDCFPSKSPLNGRSRRAISRRAHVKETSARKYRQCCCQSPLKLDSTPGSSSDTNLRQDYRDRGPRDVQRKDFVASSVVSLVRGAKSSEIKTIIHKSDEIR